MEPTPELAARLDRDRREAAARMTPSQRLLAGPAMFDVCVMMMKGAIRNQHPGADEETVNQLVREQLRKGQRLEAKG